MASSQSPQATLVVVVGNPNAGKSTLFNGLTGIRQHVGNYPGVTVERRSGELNCGQRQFELVDLPGTYSLAAASPEEMLSVRVLLGQPQGAEPPEVILCVVDASNLERNLFLVSQVLELQRPTVVALNMMDVAERRGIQVNIEQLSKGLGVPVVPVQAKNRVGFDELKSALCKLPLDATRPEHRPFEAALDSEIESLIQLAEAPAEGARFAATRLLFDTNGFMRESLAETNADWVASVDRVRQTIHAEDGAHECESKGRYQWIRSLLADAQSRETEIGKSTWSDRLDRWLTHPFFGLIFAAIILVVLFQLVFWMAEPASTLIDQFNDLLSSGVSAFLAEGTLHSLLVDGLINGVGGVLVFLPQILLLFMILAVLEDSGYLARAAFLLDRYLSRLGLSGVTLFPLLSSFACAIPGIMATRVIKDPRERLITILIAPLMSCSARLPVYVLLIAAFVPAHSILGGWLGLQGLVMFSMYLVGVLAAVLVAWLLKKTLLRTGTSSFVLELPSYKVPSLTNVGRRMFDGGWAFVRDAGTMIVAVTILVWAAGYFPRVNLEQPPAELAPVIQRIADLDDQLEQLPEAEHATLQAAKTEAENVVAAYQLRHSILGQTGQWLEPVVRPLGWDWRIGSAALASFPAREVIVSTLGVIFGLGEEVDEGSDSLRASLTSATWDGTDRPLFTLPVALSIMVFFALCAQCVSTLAVIKRETNSWRWPIFTFTYMTVLAYIAALLTYQLGSWLSGGS